MEMKYIKKKVLRIVFISNYSKGLFFLMVSFGDGRELGAGLFVGF